MIDLKQYWPLSQRSFLETPADPEQSTSSWLIWEISKVAGRLNSCFENSDLLHLLNLERLLHKYGSQEYQSHKEPSEHIKYLHSLVMVAVLADNEVPFEDSRSNNLKKLEKLAASKDLCYTSDYFTNSNNARVKIADISLITTIVNSGGFSPPEGIIVHIEKYYLYLKNVLAFNLMQTIVSKPGKELVIDKIVFKLNSKISRASIETNRMVSELFQLMNLFKAFEELDAMVQPTKPGDNWKAYRDKFDQYERLSNLHPDQFVNFANAKMKELKRNGGQSGEQKAVGKSSTEGPTADRRAIVEEIVGDPENSNESGNPSEKILTDFEKKYRAYFKWKEDLKKTPPVSFKRLRYELEDHALKKKEIVKELEVVKDTVEATNYAELKLLAEVGVPKIIEELKNSVEKCMSMYTKYKVKPDAPLGSTLNEFHKINKSFLDSLIVTFATTVCIRVPSKTIEDLLEKLEFFECAVQLIRLEVVQNPNQTSEIAAKEKKKLESRISKLLDKFPQDILKLKESDFFLQNSDRLKISWKALKEKAKNDATSSNSKASGERSIVSDVSETLLNKRQPRISPSPNKGGIVANGFLTNTTEAESLNEIEEIFSENKKVLVTNEVKKMGGSIPWTLEPRVEAVNERTIIPEALGSDLQAEGQETGKERQWGTHEIHLYFRLSKKFAVNFQEIEQIIENYDLTSMSHILSEEEEKDNCEQMLEFFRSGDARVAALLKIPLISLLVKHELSSWELNWLMDLRDLSKEDEIEMQKKDPADHLPLSDIKRIVFSINTRSTAD